MEVYYAYKVNSSNTQFNNKINDGGLRTMMNIECKDINDIKMILAELSNISESFVIDEYDAIELYILLKHLEDTFIRNKEEILKDKFLYNIALEHMQNLINMPEDNYLKNIDKHINIYEVNEPFYTKAEFDKLAQNIKNIQELYKVDTKIKYELEFEDKIGQYTIHFDNKICPIDIFRPNRIYENSRIVKKLIEDSDSYIESYDIDKDYIIIKNDKINKFIIFTRPNRINDIFYYLAPEEYCKDADRV